MPNVNKLPDDSKENIYNQIIASADIDMDAIVSDDEFYHIVDGFIMNYEDFKTLETTVTTNRFMAKLCGDLPITNPNDPRVKVKKIYQDGKLGHLALFVENEKEKDVAVQNLERITNEWKASWNDFQVTPGNRSNIVEYIKNACASNAWNAVNKNPADSFSKLSDNDLKYLYALARLQSFYHNKGLSFNEGYSLTNLLGVEKKGDCNDFVVLNVHLLQSIGLEDVNVLEIPFHTTLIYQSSNGERFLFDSNRDIMPWDVFRLPESTSGWVPLSKERLLAPWLVMAGVYSDVASNKLLGLKNENSGLSEELNEVKEKIQIALDLAPHLTAALILSSQLFLDENIKFAEEQAAKAVQINEKNAAAWGVFAMTQSKLKKMNQAVPAFLKSLELQSSTTVTITFSKYLAEVFSGSSNIALFKSIPGLKAESFYEMALICSKDTELALYTLPFLRAAVLLNDKNADYLINYAAWSIAHKVISEDVHKALLICKARFPQLAKCYSILGSYYMIKYSQTNESSDSTDLYQAGENFKKAAELDSSLAQDYIDWQRIKNM